MIKLIASDMDGTLLDDEGNLPENFFPVLDELKARGIRFVVASGRPYYTLVNNFKPRSNEISYIADNGSCVVLDNKLAYNKTFNREYLEEIVSECNKIPNSYVVLCGTKGAYVFNFELSVSPEAKMYYSNINSVINISNIDDEIYKIGVYDPSGAVDNSYKRLYPMFSEKFDVVVSGATWTDIMLKGVNKGEALGFIQKELNIKPEETMAFGDYYNDVEMLSKAKYSFVMENANEDMRKYALYRALPNKDGGVIKAIFEYVLDKRD